MTYARKEEIEAIMGMTIDDDGNSRPSETHLTEMLHMADSLINAEARRNTNAVDNSGRLKVIACSLVIKMITNMLAFTDPETYGFIEVELNDDQKRIIHLELGVWDSLTWDVGS